MKTSITLRNRRSFNSLVRLIGPREVRILITVRGEKVLIEFHEPKLPCRPFLGRINLHTHASAKNRMPSPCPKKYLPDIVLF